MKKDKEDSVENDKYSKGIVGSNMETKSPQTEDTFLNLKRKAPNDDQNLSNESKFRTDSLNKKVKAKFFTMLHQTLSIFVNKKLPKIPQKIVTNVSIRFNKELLLKSIKQIYRESVLFPSDEELAKLVQKNKQKEFFKILDTSFSEAFENYLKCPIFDKHLKEIYLKNGIEYKLTFEEECRKFVEYYNNSKPKGINS